MQFYTNINRRLDTDVLVIGGGTAGPFAAISAARLGARVLLVEKNNTLGGTVTAAGVNFPDLFWAEGRQIIAGPCFEAIERCAALGGAVMPKISKHPAAHYLEQIKLDKFIYSTTVLSMCIEAGVELLFCCMPSHIEERPDEIRAVLTDKEGLLSVRAAMLIDASGDGNAARLAGCEFLSGDERQPATLQNLLSDYDRNEVDMAALKEAFWAEGLPDFVRFEDIVGCLDSRQINLHIPCPEGESSAGRTLLEASARTLALRVFKMLREVSGLKSLSISFAAEETGVRESLRILGRKTVSAEDYLAGRRYDDAVCYAYYPIDRHVMHGIEQQFLPHGVLPTVPLGAMLPKGFSRILCAGRCISADRDAMSALRVQAVCMAEAQAAGCAAALSKKDGIDFLYFKELCDALESIGAIVPK